MPATFFGTFKTENNDWKNKKGIFFKCWLNNSNFYVFQDLKVKRNPKRNKKVL